jgi:AAA domain (dynein-related subfamily)
LGGDIDRWRIGDLVVSPPNQLDLSMLLLGQPGVGKSTVAERITHLAAQENRQVVAIDGKGDEDFAAGIIALNLTARPDARIGLFPATLRPLALVAGRAGRPPHGCLVLHSRGRVLRQHRPARPPAGDLGPRPSADPVGRPAGRVARPGLVEPKLGWPPGRVGIIRDLKGRLAEVVVRMGNLPPPWAGCSMAAGRSRT